MSGKSKVLRQNEKFIKGQPEKRAAYHWNRQLEVRMDNIYLLFVY